MKPIKAPIDLDNPPLLFYCKSCTNLCKRPLKSGDVLVFDRMTKELTCRNRGVALSPSKYVSAKICATDKFVAMFLQGQKAANDNFVAVPVFA